MEKLEVFKAINKVSLDISQIGVAKNKINSLQKYYFRGIDELLNALSPLLAKHELIIMPRVISRTLTEQTTKAGGNLYYTVVDIDFDFISSKDGSKYTAKIYGEASDTADKGTNKALNAAYKYLCFLVFCVPLEAVDDADLFSPEELMEKKEQLLAKYNREAQAASLKGLGALTIWINNKPLHEIDDAAPFATRYKAAAIIVDEMNAIANQPQPQPQPEPEQGE